MITYNYATVRNQKIFYREAGDPAAPTIVLLHGFPTSSHMFRDLIPQLEDKFHIIAPDFPGFGYSDAPSASTFTYTFDNLAAYIDELLFTTLDLTKFTIYVQDYGAPVGYRIAAAHPEAITGIIVQNGNAYAEGIGAGFDPLKTLWANRTPENEAATRTAMLSFETTRFQYTHGTKNPAAISPDSYTLDQYFLDRPGNAEIQIDLAYDYQNNLKHYPTWQAFFRNYQPPTLIVWGQNDPFFTVEGAKAYLRDIPKAELNLIDTGHFALEEESHFIAEKIRTFFAA
ncbi:alpha/beta fold hydrolase [Granulicella aggregans]|uniref:alpha/beta fold hydrolase n=1 Tax=Granulicella aggregans TaxID=474949 RepID=UPI0021DFEBF7|nr:alpha/beta hydrolase [Granulicella aggregans]